MTTVDDTPGPLLVDVAGTDLTADDRALLADPAVGGVILFTRNFESKAQLSDLTGEIRENRSGLIVVADYEGGRVQRFVDGFTRIPPMAALGSLHARDPRASQAAAEALGWLVAHELAEVGIDMPLAPVADRDHGHSSVIGHRAFSDEPKTITTLAGAYADGLSAGGSAATIKHFPGHGWVHADSHAELPVDDRNREALAADWQPFADLVSHGVASVMMAHVRYPAIDTTPASLSRTWIETILRQSLGFAGCVFCDDLSMGGAAAFGDHATRARAALMAGCDYLPVCNDRAAALTARDAVTDRLSEGLSRRRALQATLATNRRAAAQRQADDERRGENARRMARDLAAL